MTISEFSRISNVNETTIKRNVSRIKGISYDEEGKLVIPDGTRYPYNPRRNKFDTQGKRLCALLDATYYNRYIDCEILKMTLESFSSMIEGLISEGLLRPNGIKNPYGANSFDTTMKYERMRADDNNRHKKEFSDFLASILSHILVETGKKLIIS